ncbi:MAG: CPBP family intramembrane metalloprotease [Defluviitaleaceae bacterium]|nr:CPBP family intramembrane metalloprotease [Defluviitaleaceae bacterium]
MAHRRGIFFMLFWMIYSFAYLIIFELLFFPGQLLYILGVQRSALVSSLWFQIFYQITIFLLPLTIWLAFFKEKINTHLPHMKLGKTNIIYIIGLSIFVQPAMMVVSGITNIFFPNEIGEFLMGSMNQPFWLLILAIAVTPAICEEVVFRGYVQSTYKNKPLITMLLINGLFFGIMHMNGHQFFFAFLAGVLFAYMVHATRSIRAGIIAHFIMNASQVSLMWFSFQLLRWTKSQGKQLEQATAVTVNGVSEANYEMVGTIIAFATLGIIAIGATVCAVYLFYQFVKHNKKRVAEYEATLESVDTTEEIIIEPEVKRKNLIIDSSLILAIVTLYVFFVFGIR